jgi:hypothetical protein
MMFWKGWEGEALAAFGYRMMSMGIGTPTGLLGDGHVTAFTGWGKCESGADGTKGAANNPCGTTLKMPGSTAFNSAGVQNYAARWDGIRAMAAMLSQQNMAPIREALLEQPISLQHFADAVAKESPWGTGYSCLQSVYGLKP